MEKVGIEPEVQRIGKYKSAGDQLTRKSMSEANCEMLTTLLDNIYGNWLDKISSTKGSFYLRVLLKFNVSNVIHGSETEIFYVGKKREELENFINEGVYEVERLKEEGLITNIHYDDEVEKCFLSLL